MRLALPARAQRSISQEVADSWDVALAAADLLRQRFPDFFAAHLADRVATLEAGLGACCALWLQMERAHGLRLRWPQDEASYYYGSTIRDEMITADTAPEDLLAAFDGVSEEWMSGLGFWLGGPRPAYHGWNVQSAMSGDAGPPGQLTGLIWHLLSQTEASVGGFAAIEQALAQWDEEARFDVLRIPPLSPSVRAGDLLALVAQGIPEARNLPTPAQLLRYPLGATGNPLADTGEDDINAVHMGDDPEYWGWDDAARLGAMQREARELSEAFIAWRDRVEAGGLPALRQVAALFHRAARRLARDDDERPRTLAEILGVEGEAEAPDLARLTVAEEVLV